MIEAITDFDIQCTSLLLFFFNLFQASVIEAFDQSLCNMAYRLQRIANSNLLDVGALIIVIVIIIVRFLTRQVVHKVRIASADGTIQTRETYIYIIVNCLSQAYIFR